MIGLSKLRESKTFTSYPFYVNLDGRDVASKHGLYVIDTLNGDAVCRMKIDGIVEELYYTGDDIRFASTHGLRVQDRTSPARHPRWQAGGVVSTKIIRG